MCIPTSAPRRIRNTYPTHSVRKTEQVSPAVSRAQSLLSQTESAGASPDQLTALTSSSSRREKSRLAAKTRRRNENQALIYLRLALPVQTAGKSKPLVDATSDTSVLQSIPNYRKASTLSRQQRLPAPEFEKAVTIRLASSSLCLYSHLYPPAGCAGSQTGSVSLMCPEVTGGPVSISVHSRSLVAVLVDMSENSVVYAPPAYTGLLGLTWNVTIGLQLHEVRSRQFLAASGSSTPTAFQQQLCQARAKPATMCGDDSGSAWDRPDEGTCDVWQCSGSCRPGRAQVVSSLLPPVRGGPGESSVGPDWTTKKTTAADVERVYAVCWSSSQLASKSSCDPWGSALWLDGPSWSCQPAPLCDTAAESFSSDCDLVLCLLQPIPLVDLLSASCRELTTSSASSFVRGLPRSYHRLGSLDFLTACPSALSGPVPGSGECGETQEYPRTRSLVDLVHLDELERFVEDVASLSLGQPLVTSVLRLRTNNTALGTYRFARLVLFLAPRDLLLDDLIANGGDVSTQPSSESTAGGHLSHRLEPPGSEAPRGDSELVVCCYQLAHSTSDAELSNGVPHSTRGAVHADALLGPTDNPTPPHREQPRRASAPLGNETGWNRAQWGCYSATDPSLPAVTHVTTTTTSVSRGQTSSWPSPFNLSAGCSSLSSPPPCGEEGRYRACPGDSCRPGTDCLPVADRGQPTGPISSPTGALRADRCKYSFLDDVEDKWFPPTVRHCPRSIAAPSDLLEDGSRGSSTAALSPPSCYAESCSSPPFWVPQTGVSCCRCSLCSAGQLLPQAEVLPVAVERYHRDSATAWQQCCTTPHRPAAYGCHPQVYNTLASSPQYCFDVPVEFAPHPALHVTNADKQQFASRDHLTSSWRYDGLALRPSSYGDSFVADLAPSACKRKRPG